MENLKKTIFHTNKQHETFGKFPRIKNLKDNDLKIIYFCHDNSKMMKFCASKAESDEKKIEYLAKSYLMELRGLVYLYVGNDLFPHKFITKKKINSFEELENWKKEIDLYLANYTEDIFEYVINEQIIDKIGEINTKGKEM